MGIYRFKIRLLRENMEGRPERALQYEQENLHPEAHVYAGNNKQLIILGSPIYRGKIDYKAVSGKILESGIRESSILDFDGSFLFVLYDKKDLCLTIANDRFASIPFYYLTNEGGLVGSVNYGDMCEELFNSNSFTLNKEAFYEFILFQRLFGNKTYDAKTRYLDSASILRFKAGSPTVEINRYWRPNFSKKDMADEEASRTLADLVSKSVSERTNDNRRYGLLLSGGLDSRLVLAAFKRPIHCLTIGEFENNECRVAKETAETRGCPYSFVRRRKSHYADILEDAAFLGNAMNMFVHGHFLKLEDSLRPKADVFFHGYGFDYMFQGKYLPYVPVKLFSKKTYLKSLINLDRDVKDQFITHINYRLKSIDPLYLVPDKERDRIKEFVYSSIQRVLEEGRNYCNNGLDFWEYLVMHNISRHYTFLNIMSLRTIAEERTVAFDNELFDFYLSLPAKSRLNKMIFVNAIKLLDERLYKIRNANTNFNIYDSDFVLTAKLSVNKALRKFGFRVLLPPEQKERSWPVKTDIISENDKIKKAAKNLINSGALEGLGFLDMNNVRLYVERHLQGEGDYSDLILTLITIETFIKNNQRRVKREKMICQL